MMLSVSSNGTALSANNYSSCIAITERTSIPILLNSSKQAQAPAPASPLKNLASIVYSISGEQLKTTHYLASALARSLVVSVLPVPAGPAGAPPLLSFSAPIRVI
jgi:hypothetical protein